MTEAGAQIPRWCLPLAALGATAAYVGTAARAVLGGDNGEFATLFAVGGVAHPSGYPLYTLWLRAWSWLPAASPAHGAAVATALLGGAAVGAVGFASRAWGASRVGALFAMATWAFAPLAWRLSTHAEVFALNALLAAIVAALAGPHAPVRGERRAVLLGLAAGAGLANHLSIALLAPLGVYGVVVGVRESTARARTLLFAALALLPGLATYWHLVAAARDPGGGLVWGDTRTLRGLVAHVLRRDYGTLRLSASAAQGDPWAEVSFCLRGVVSGLHVLPAVLGFAGFFALAPEEESRGERLARAAFGASLALAGPLFLARFNIAPVGVGAAVVERFLLLPETLLAVMAARGFDHVVERGALGARTSAALVAGVALAGLARAWPEVRDDHRDAVERYLLDTLDTVPDDAVVLGTGDHRTLGFPYVQRALGRRRGVLHIDPRLLPLAAYRARVERALGRRFPFPLGPSVPTVRVAETALATGRPVFLTDVFTPMIPRALPTYPYGTVIRVLARGAEVPSPEAVLVMNEQLYRGYRFQPTREPMAPWQSLVREDYARAWRSLAETARATRHDDLARTLAARADLYAFTEAP